MPSSKYVHTLQTCQYKLNNVRCLLYIHAIVSSTPVLVWKLFLAQLKVFETLLSHKYMNPYAKQSFVP